MPLGQCIDSAQPGKILLCTCKLNPVLHLLAALEVTYREACHSALGGYPAAPLKQQLRQ